MNYLLFLFLISIIYIEMRFINFSFINRSFNVKNLITLKDIYFKNVGSQNNTSILKTSFYLCSILILSLVSSEIVGNDVVNVKWLLFLPIIDLLVNFEESNSPYIINTLLIFLIVMTFNRIPLVLSLFQCVYFLETIRKRSQGLNFITCIIHIVFFLSLLSLRSIYSLSVHEDLFGILLVLPVLFVTYEAVTNRLPQTGIIKKINYRWVILTTSVILEVLWT